MQWWYDQQEQQAGAREDRDVEQRDEAMSELAAEWGGDYKDNVAVVKNVIALAPEAIRGLLLEGNVRFDDDRSIGNHPDTLRWLADLGRLSGIASTYVGGGGLEAQAASVEDEIEAIEKLMRVDRPAYDRDGKKQGRLRELYAFQERRAAQGG